jgi:hypothetical protein
MLFQIVQPIVADIYGDSFKEAIKNYVKFNHNLNITNMIIKDQSNHYQARLRYYTENQKNKVGIDVYPYTNVSYPIMAAPALMTTNPLITTKPLITTNPLMAANTIVTSPVPLTFGSANPLVTVKGSNVMANNKNVIVNYPSW